MLVSPRRSGVVRTRLAGRNIDCTAEGVATAENGGGGGSPVTQEGLVNLAITNTTIQVPVAVAANVCGLAVNILARGLNTGDVTCTATGVSRAFR
jgi:hypothetical protein